jgi:CheY-like chemotaxis protein
MDMVLVIDDEEDVRETVRDVLSDLGYDVATANNGRDALTLLEESDLPCLILLDLAMPVMNGWEFLREVEGSGRWAAVPVVIASAHSGPHPPAGRPLLPKPIELQELVSTVEQHCGRPC